jgi:hypothetical protein
MRQLRSPAVVFGLASFSASLPIAWFFWGLEISDSVFGRYLWLVLPGFAAILAALSALLLSRATVPAGFGAWRGFLAALISLVGCSAIGHPTLVLPALVFVSWLVLPLGALAGWFIGRRLSPNNSFKPNPLRGSA